MHKKLTIIVVAATFGLAGCSGSDTDRALVGAGAGALAAVVLDGDVVTSAAAGAAVGALCDDVTTYCN